MTKVYLLIMICGTVAFAYLIGGALGQAKCQEKIAQTNSYVSQQKLLIKEKINAEVYNVGVNDIRNILRTKYTIAD